MDIVKSKNKQKDKGSPVGATFSSHVVDVKTSTLRQVKFEYDGETFEFSPLIIYILCFLVGIIGGIYGIGGGAIVAPFFVAIIGLPVYTVAGAALMGTFITSVAGVIFYQFWHNFIRTCPYHRTGCWLDYSEPVGSWECISVLEHKNSFQPKSSRVYCVSVYFLWQENIF